jgi:hypothetical protein
MRMLEWKLESGLAKGQMVVKINWAYVSRCVVAEVDWTYLG